MKSRAPWAAAALLLVMALLIVGPAREDSATVDEPSHLSAGYLHLKGHSTRMGCDDHPPLGQMIEAFPWLFMDVKLPQLAQMILRGELGYPWTMTWHHKI